MSILLQDIFPGLESRVRMGMKLWFRFEVLSCLRRYYFIFKSSGLDITSVVAAKFCLYTAAIVVCLFPP